MYAVVEIGGGQYKVQKGESFEAIGVANAKKGSSIDFKKVLLIKDGNTIHVGTPYVKGASVNCTVLACKRGDKVIAYKSRKRKSSKKKIGHRQEIVKLEVADIGLGK